MNQQNEVTGNIGNLAGRDITINQHSPAFDDLLRRFLELQDKYIKLLESQSLKALSYERTN